ncbi:hypothetical protein J3E69DRAFT_336439 [Trichoderma sp. SZMC 28015]
MRREHAALLWIPAYLLASHLFMHPGAGMMLTRFYYAAVSIFAVHETISVICSDFVLVSRRPYITASSLSHTIHTLSPSLA